MILLHHIKVFEDIMFIVCWLTSKLSFSTSVAEISAIHIPCKMLLSFLPVAELRYGCPGNQSNTLLTRSSNFISLQGNVNRTESNKEKCLFSSVFLDCVQPARSEVTE
uniref:PPUP8358 n=1 Tax=Poeciliopsis prolifica TaxID=188132 RepID=A0A0S7ELD9_9TELE